jgi:aconitase B
MGIPHRLQQVLATQQKLEAASAYANEVNKGWAKAEWYAKDAQKLSKRQEAFAASGSSSLHAVFPAPGSASAAREAGVKTAVEVSTRESDVSHS